MPGRVEHEIVVEGWYVDVDVTRESWWDEEGVEHSRITISCPKEDERGVWGVIYRDALRILSENVRTQDVPGGT